MSPTGLPVRIPGGNMNTKMTRLLSVGTTALIASCGADPSDMNAEGLAVAERIANKITGSVSEWAVEVSAGKAEAGEVTFAIANFGSIKHEFLVAKTSYEPGKIPVGENNRFDEEDPGITVVDEIKEWSPNEAKVLRLSLEPGQYELLCNIEAHYANGMWHAFEVVEGDGAAEMSSGGESSDGDAVSNDITGSVSEWAVSVSASGAKAGEVSFTIENQGSIAHEFLVAKTDIAPGEIPLTEEGKFDEALEGLEVIDEIKEWPAGETKTLKVTLEPGKYQLLCNIVDHYKAGMWTGFVVS